MVFEPSPVWLDDSAMATDETAKIYLRNVLGKSKGKVRELKPQVEKKRSEIENVKIIRQNARDGKDKRDQVELARAFFSMLKDLHQIERQCLTAEVETSTITASVGDVSIGGQNHRFKSQTYKVPTNCDLCGERLWGLSAKGFDCLDCGYTCHSKCELKVPATCPGEQTKEERKKLKAERQAASKSAPPQTNGGPKDGATELPVLSRSNTMDTLSSGYAASANRSISGRMSGEDISEEKALPPQPAASKPATARKNRIVAPPPTQYVSEAPSTGRASMTSNPAEPRAKAIYTYQATTDGEVSIDESDEVVVVESDGINPLPPAIFFKNPSANPNPNTDGSGWTTIRHASTTGLVPTSYLEPLPPLTPRPPSSHSYSSSSASLTSSATLSGAAKKKGPAVAPKRGAKKLNYVEALYDYDARSDSEWSMTGGERFVLISRDSGDGWADVEKGGVRRSVPANYIQEI